MTNQSDILKDFPVRRIRPVDGMAVTAAVWDEAHEYHRHQLRFHQILQHGAGIVAGLHVVASDPPDSAVYVSPGLAIDAQGREIRVPEPFAFDLGAARGKLHLLLTHGESQPRTDGQNDEGVLYSYAEYSLEAGATLQNTMGVELARINRVSSAAVIENAAHPASPQLNAIDLRYRREIGLVAPRIASVAVCQAGQNADRIHAHGADVLAQALNRSPQLRVWVDVDAPLTSDLNAYTLVYLVGHSAYQLGPDEMNAIYAYLQSGGTLYYESCRRGLDGEPPGDVVFLDMLASLGVTLEDLPPVHPLCREPNLFTTLPAGYDPARTGAIKLSGGVIFSTFDHGCVWCGEQRSGSADRSVIRSAHEWGENIVQYALNRQANKS